MRTSTISGASVFSFAVLVLGLTFGSAVSAQTPAAASAAIPPAPAGGLDPSKLPDIEGIHLGAAPDVVIPKIKALQSSAGAIQIATAQYVSTPDPKWNAYVYTNGGMDKLMATFSAPPNKQALVSLERDTTFQVGQQPTLDTIKTALFQKYGANPVQVSTGTTLPAMWVWTFNEQGGPMVPAPPATFPRQILSCGATIIAPKANIQAYTPSALPLDAQTLKQWMTMRCNSLGVYVVATFSGSSMSVVMTDTAEDMRDALAGQQYIEKINAAKQQNLQKDTQKNVPTL